PFNRHDLYPGTRVKGHPCRVRERSTRHDCRYRCSASEERKTDFPLRVRLSPIGLAIKRAEAEEEREEKEVPTIHLGLLATSVIKPHSIHPKGPSPWRNALISLTARTAISPNRSSRRFVRRLSVRTLARTVGPQSRNTIGSFRGLIFDLSITFLR